MHCGHMGALVATGCIIRRAGAKYAGILAGVSFDPMQNALFTPLVEYTGRAFVSRTEPLAEASGAACWFVFQEDRLLVRLATGGAAVPLAPYADDLRLPLVRTCYLGYLASNDGVAPVNCYAAELPTTASIPEGLIADGLRNLYPRIGDLGFGLAGRAVQLLTWDRTHQYCGQCGGHTEPAPNERAKRCPACGLLSYPRLSPAIIIAVVRRDGDTNHILLARNHRFPPGRFSVLAGYVEPGETLEDCARREVYEEVGVHIQDITYFSSQPWPFPHSLMIGFTANYAGGDITLEEAEIAEAHWFAADALPGIPPPMTIARRLIDWFVAGAHA